MSPADIGLVRLGLGGGGLALLQFLLVHARLQHGHGRGAVAVLGPVGLACHHDPGGDVGDADGRFRLVDVLAARARCTERIHTQVGFVDLDLDRIIDHRIDPHGCKRCLPPRRRIKRRDPDKTMHPRLGLEPAIGIGAADLDGGGLDAGLLPFRTFHHGHLVTMLFGPAGVHAQQHFGPVLRLRPARASVDFKVAVIAVRLPRKQAFGLTPLGFFRKRAQAGQRFGHDSRIAFHFRQFHQFDRIVHIGFKPLHALDLVGQQRALAHELLGGFGIIPQLRVFGPVVQLRKAVDCDIPVKDASSAVPPTA